jgi:hypothetical protein
MTSGPSVHGQDHSFRGKDAASKREPVTAIDALKMPAPIADDPDLVIQAAKIQALLPARAAGAFFPDIAIDSVLRRQDTSLVRLLASLAGLDSYHLERIQQYGKVRSRDDIESLVANSPHVPIKYFPLIYNLVSKFISPSDFLDLTLNPIGTWERTRDTLRWMPLYLPHLDKSPKNAKVVERLISTLIENERDEKISSWSQPYEELARNASAWWLKVTPTFRKKLAQDIYARDVDLALFHELPFVEIPEGLRKNRLSRYIRSSDVEVPTTQLVRAVKSQNQYAGTCGWCQGTHWENLMAPDQEQYGRVVVIRVEGRAIFSLKLYRDPSMVALQSCKTPDGKFAVIRGGLYVPSKELSETLRPIAREQKEKFFVADIQEPMTAYPLGWIDTVDDRWNDAQRQSYLAELDKLASSSSRL